MQISVTSALPAQTPRAPVRPPRPAPPFHTLTQTPRRSISRLQRSTQSSERGLLLYHSKHSVLLIANDWLPYIAQKDYSQAASTLPAGYVLVSVISTRSVHSNFDNICCAGGRSVSMLMGESSMLIILLEFQHGISLMLYLLGEYEKFMYPHVSGCNFYRHNSFSWEQKWNKEGQIYYVDHNTGTTTWRKPSMQKYRQWPLQVGLWSTSL